MEIVDTTFPPLDNKLAWCFALLGVALLILLQPKEQRLRSIPLWAIALGLAYLVLELRLPILQFAAVALAVFALLTIGLIWWLTKRLHQIAEQLYNAQEAYQQNHDKAAYLAGLEQCSKQLKALRWFGKRATIRQTKNQPDVFAEIKLADYLEQQKQLLQTELAETKEA